MSRRQAYLWLAKQLGVPEPEAHMTVMTDPELLRRVVLVSDAFLGSTTLEDDFSSPPPLPPTTGAQQ